MTAVSNVLSAIMKLTNKMCFTMPDIIYFVLIANRQKLLCKKERKL